MNDKHKYYAFISYKREDEEWAAWLQHEFEHYRLPSTLNGRPDLPTEFGPIFRDVDELSAGNLPAQIHEALKASAHLIVVCSPLSAQSEWVNKEVSDFIEIGRRKGIDNIDNIFPFIVEGTPHAARAAEECFPAILRDLPASRERIGGNVNETGRDKAFIKTLAGMLRIRFDELWQRYEKEKIEEERRKREERNRLQLIQSRFLAEKATDLADRGDSYLARLLALQALPKRLGDPEDRPYCPEAEAALRVADGKRSAIIRGHTDSVNSVALSPDGKFIVSASGDKTIRVWNVESGIEICCLTGHTYSVNSVALSLDGKFIVSASGDKTVRVWNVESGIEIHKLEGHTRRVIAAVFSPNEKLIISGSSDKTLRIWDIENRTKAYKLEGHCKPLTSVSLSPDGKLIISASHDKTIRIWNIESGRSIYKFTKPSYSYSIFVAFSPNGKLIASVLQDNKTLCIWNMHKAKEICILEGHIDSISSIAFSPDGKQIASASRDKTVRIWDVKTGKEVYKLEGHADSISSVAFSPDGKQIASASYDKTIRIWDVETGKEIYKFEVQIKLIFSVAFNLDGTQIVFASLDGIIWIWNVETGKEIYRIEGHDSPVKSATFSPNGRQVLFASDKVIWICTFEPLQELIDRTRERFENRPLTQDEKKKYYLD